MTEIQVIFGSDRHLVGTLTLPDAGDTLPVAVLLYNAGVIARMGPHRLNVKIARALARRGIASLRFDLSGQGDSRMPAKAHSFKQQALNDLAAAMEHVERICNIQRFVVGGICSGAHNGLASALQNPGVVGLWMLDGHAFPTAKTVLVRQTQRLRRAPARTLAGWANRIVRSALPPLRKLSAPAPSGLETLDLGMARPSREDFARSIQTLLDRDVDLLVLYTASAQWDYNYPSQWRDAFSAFPTVASIRCEYLPGIDHTATRLAAQSLLIDKLTDWTLQICNRQELAGP